MANDSPKSLGLRRSRAESGGDLLASLTREEQKLREKLEEEKKMLHDVDRTFYLLLHFFL